MLTIHHLNQSRSERIVWLAEELGLDYTLVQHQRDPQTYRAPASLWAVSPVGKAPAIEHDGQTLFESGAIVDYVMAHWSQGRLQPAAGTPEAVRYLQWMHSAESTLATPVVLLLMAQLTGDDNPRLRAFAEGDLRLLLGHVEQLLGPRGYMAGAEFTAVDIMVGYTLWMLDGSAVNFIPGHPAIVAEYPNIVAYLKRLRERPAYRRAAARLSP